MIRNLIRQSALALLFLVAVSAVMAQSNIYYVSPTGTDDGSSWANTMSLEKALTTAKAGDQIWVQGFDPIDNSNKLYIVPESMKATGFTLKSGVQLYGGFAGTETSINDRETLGKPYQLKYRSVLSGDIEGKDAVDNTSLIFPANMTRKDNATHVLSLNMDPASGANNNTYPTVVNGFSIGGGQADGENEYGGGIYISGDNTGGGNFRIERCFFVNNYATLGGAIYVAAEVQNVNNGESLINQCAVYNNAAGERGAVVNDGGGIYLAGEATVVNSTIFNNENGGIRLSAGSRVVNTTVARNTGAGIDLLETATGANVFNTIIWGNTLLSAEHQPNFQNSAYHEVTVTNTDAGTDDDNNVYVTKENRGDKDAPMFDAPSVKTSFDRDFNWRQMAYPLWSWNVLEGSVMHDKGDGTAYQSTTYGNQDMAGNPRMDGDIDIGAYEFQQMPAGRIRYVMQQARGTGDGTSWANASGDLQGMIDELADNNPQNLAGEVWVAAGTYEPRTQLISGTGYSASFRMRDGISVYGGFAGTESSKQERTMKTDGMPWDFDHETILEAAYYDADNLKWENNKWTLTSDSRHVVWFAPMANEAAFSRVTTLDGVTIQGGYAQGGTGVDDFKIETSFIYNNNADADGGAVYVDNRGLVLRSMLANNSAHNGAGAYLHNEVETTNDYPEYLILSTCVVSNNTMTGNGAVYCGKGGVLMQNTITNNHCVTATDATDANASQTAGIYADEYALVLNSVIWNNQKNDGTNIPMYARNPSTSTVRFLYNAISGTNNAVWNYTLQEQTLALVDENAGATNDGGSIGPRFEPTNDFDLEDDFGVQSSWKEITYYWKPVSGSNLWARGMALGQLPDEVVLAPELDIAGNTFAQKPAVGAFMVEAPAIKPSFELKDNNNYDLVLYVDVECTEPSHDGSSWKKAFRSLNDAIAYCAAVSGSVTGSYKNGTETVTVSVDHIDRFVIRVLEGDLWPRYAFVNNDPKTATVTVPASGKAIEIYGGYHRDETDPNTAVRDPLTYRSIINGNTEGKDITQGLYHCITVQQNAKLVLDGFHVINGYAAGEASLQYGAGLLAQAGSEVTVRNCIFENNTAQEGAAIDARAATLTLRNCVVNNNTNTDDSKAVINAQNLTMEHVTVVNNKGAAPAEMGTSSFSAGNTSGNSIENLASIGETGAKNFANPTNGQGATLGFDTYLGGYAEFRPLTSSTEAAVLINKATGTSAENTKDITTINGRDLGGVPDLGAYEAILPESGRVIYVRVGGTGDGLSWDNAMGNINDAVQKGVIYNNNLSDADKQDADKRAQVWVAAGRYSATPNSELNCFVIQDGVDVLGAFPKSGTPGLNDRHPLLSQFIYNETDYANYETILTKNGTNNGRILSQKDEYNPNTNNHSTFRFETTWDGFTITGGSLSKDASRAGGGGAQIFANVNLKNCVVSGNEAKAPGNYQYKSARGGGVYCDQGSVVNCYIINNRMVTDYNTAGAYYGGGAYLYNGTMYNCVVANNYIRAYYADGAGLFLENASFYNNTVVNNTAERTTNWGTEARSSGGITVWCDPNNSTGGRLELYNCIIAGNKGYNPNSSNYVYGNKNIGAQQGNINLYSCLLDTETEKITEGKVTITYQNGCINYTDNTITGANLTWSGIFENVNENDFSSSNYRLKGLPFSINMGQNQIYDLDGETVKVDLFDYTDMDFTDRIKDCTVDAGAYELDNIENTTPEVNVQNATATYYVTQNGDGTASANSEENAACAMKLQTVLNAAGQYKLNNPKYQVIVKVAGYEDAMFVYHANTLADENDPQSYSYTVPYGVELWGGYSDQDDNWEDEGSRDVMTNRTVLSAIKLATATQQEVNGYHVITFGEKPTGWTGADTQTIVDGIWLEDGSATSMAGTGNPNTRGGGAIVPAWAHVRNCVVTNCEAIEGGGLYLLPGATVSGTAVIECEATNGAGIYADNTDADNTEVDKDSRAHILSCTIANNEASSTGGGLYMEDGAVMSVNTVIFGNRAGSDKNVSGVVSQQFDDNKLATVFNITDQTSFYPFNNCFVETQEMPSDFENGMLESDKSLYFAADNYYRLKDYSLLIKHGLKNQYQDDLVTTFNVAAQDMQNIDRVQAGNAAERLDAGAFAYEGGIQPTDLFTRIFVSQTTNVTLPAEEDMNAYLGRSFYTSFSTLEDALGYIRSMRAKNEYANEEFEILVAGGTYKPSYLRTTGAAVDHDQKLYSFVVPQGVSIYGGFAGTENYSSGGITSIPTTSGNVSVDNTTPLTTILNARTYSDFNQNNILEPWELANQTILSGQINASSTAQNAYHVMFTQVDENATTVNPVVLDGLTVMYGQTDNKLSIITDNNEQGRGGGIYSNGVTYTISRCRLLNNTAVRGGAVFVRNADLNLSGCILSGNKTVANTATGQTTTLTSRGGAAYVSGIDEVVNLRAVNTLWANNESAGEGGAIGTNYAEGISSSHDPLLYIMNNTFVRNKATTNPVIYAHNGKSHIVNTLIWGNEGGTYQTTTNIANVYDVSHSASDVNYVEKFTSGNSYNNILLSTENMADKGPRFTNPSTVVGVDGNSASSLWNPVAISVLTDAGDGTKHTANKNPNESDLDHKSDGTITGAYQQWFTDNSNIAEAYITGTSNGSYSRYSGPNNEVNKPLCKPIDIGVYEYQYFSNFSTMPTIFVDTISQGDGSGNSWANATDDLRGAIVGAANPTDNVDKKRVVYVRDGNYSWDKTSAGSAYILNMLDDVKNISLTLKGSCTGSGDQQDFSKQTVLRNDGATTNLMYVSTNSKPVTIEGFTFINTTTDGTGMDASTTGGGSLTLKNCGFRISDKGLDITGNSGNVLIYNTLFADGGTGLSAGSGTTTVVNATFANNKTADMTGTANVYNSVSWNNGTNSMPTTDGQYNKVFSFTRTAAENNVDIQNGPNFVDPLNETEENRDYHIRPSVQLLNQGSNDLYLNHVVKVVADADATAIPATEVDLGNSARLVDNTIDIGAYEYEAPLQPIVYVKADLTGTADGKSWETALGDLQGAVDLAGLYALSNSGQNGYVFVHGNYNDTGLLNLSLGNTMVYGGMNDERSSTTLGDSYTKDDVEAIVSDLLAKRKGMLEATNRSSLENVTITADGVIDGFEVTGVATVNNGVLSTSVVKNNVVRAADAPTENTGLLYNSLVLGNVSDVKAVNVTATGTITEANGSGNNRASVNETNSYVTDEYWNYQLMETSTDTDIDAGTIKDLKNYTDLVGHECDLIGNKRIRNTVDNGCFETWNISEGMTTGNVISATDYPVGKSVVYVRKGQELSITANVYPNGNAFTPGFLLLEHQAGLRGNGNYISLTNFAVERDIPAKGADLVAMPFDVNSTTSVLAGLKPKRYDGSVRAAYDYKFDDGQSTGNQTAWTEQNMDQAGMYEGLLFENTTEQNQTLRFYGKSTAPYTENGTDKSISLQKYNFNETWTTDENGNIVPSTSNRFTHKENMSWNLFGSPYLCAMNYSDLEYGRVLYGYNGSYRTVNTAEVGTEGGHIPAGSAVFTQTATLRDAETFSVKQPFGSKSGKAFSRFAPVQVVIESLATTKSADQALRDDIGLSTVTPEFASTQFDLGSDGVKWMAGDETIPQIYMQRDGGRYSLLSAVNVEGSVEVGVRVGEPGDYLLYLPEKLDLSDYSSILLTDRHAGKMVDLKQGSYAFTATRATDMEGRFSLSFNRSIEAVDLEVKFYSPTPGVVIVEGLPEHARVNWYTTMGRLVEIREAANWKETFYLRSDIYMMEVYDMEGKERIGSYKVRVR